MDSGREKWLFGPAQVSLPSRRNEVIFARQIGMEACSSDVWKCSVCTFELSGFQVNRFLTATVLGRVTLMRSESE